MRERLPELKFLSPLGEMMRKFIQEKRACGYRYVPEAWLLRRLDRFLCERGSSAVELPRPLVERWTTKQPHERPRTHQTRIVLTRQFALFLRRHDVQAHVPDAKLAPMSRLDFVPHIFRREEVEKILNAADRLPPNCHSPLRHLIMPEVFRLLYGCGMRVSEVLRLKVAGVDIAAGVLTVRDGKFGKDRHVPFAPSVAARLRKYSTNMGERDPEVYFFPAPDGGRYSIGGIYGVFRRLLWECGIPHGGRGKGPRVHDLRHTFAVHKLENWYRQGADLGAKLPVLAVYMGHRTLGGTQRYLRLTPSIFPDITRRLDAATGHIIPERRKHETD